MTEKCLLSAIIQQIRVTGEEKISFVEVKLKLLIVLLQNQHNIENKQQVHIEFHRSKAIYQIVLESMF